MKKFYFSLLIAIVATAGIYAQTPDGINYQSVVRDGSGQIVVAQDIILQISILQGSATGENVYTENHSVTTNNFGLVNLTIGEGEVQTGDFAVIKWGSSSFFLKTAVDLSGGGSFQELGVTQFLSVPYSLYSNTSGNGIQSMTTEERDAIENPSVGMQIYNSTTNCLNYFNGISWFETCGDCTPMPSQANAGPDQYFADENISTYLEANTPEFGTGTWSVVSGNGGTFEDAGDPNTLFTGLPCEFYTLKWTISNPCGATSDNVNINFDNTPTTADAGEDQLFLDNTTTTVLQGNIPEMGEGLWSIQNGQGGSFDDPYDPTTEFTGLQCETYTLRWTISTPCHESYDEVIIEFNNTPTPADAGPDQWYLQGTSTTLEGNTPENGLGYWSIVSGTGGTIQFPTNPNSVFIGQQEVVYELKWTISTECNSSSDNVIIYFGVFQCGLPLIDVRDGQIYQTVQIGEQCWMAENLNIGTMINGSNDQTDDGTIEKYCYENSTSNCDTYGGLYQWNEMMQYTTTQGVQGICPEGWHLPTDAEWTTLVDFLGGSSVAGGKMKEAGYAHWNSPNTGATNESGFTALPGGCRNTFGYFNYLGSTAYFWSSTEDDTYVAWDRYLFYNSDNVVRYDNAKHNGYSVRCFQD